MKFANKASCLTYVFVFNESNQEPTCTIEATTNDIFGFQCGPSIDFNVKHKKLYGYYKPNFWLVDPDRCFKHVYSQDKDPKSGYSPIILMNHLEHTAEYYPKYSEMTKFGRVRHVRYLKLNEVTQQKLFSCECSYYENRNHKYVGTMIANTAPPKGGIIFVQAEPAIYDADSFTVQVTAD